MTPAELAAYWARQSSDHRPVIGPEQAGLTDAEWSLGWE